MTKRSLCKGFVKLSPSALLGWIGVILLVNACAVQAESPNERMDWFHETKFGMFIHFGVTAQGRLQNNKMTPGEKYEAAAREFNPIDFDAKEWVRIAKDGGMKYIVFTSKHHDGFCNWDSALTDWDIMDQTVFKRDIIAELAEACKAEGIRLGFYYSIADWHHPEYHTDYSNRSGFHYRPNPDADITKYIDYMHGQLRELCERYQPCLIWFDGSAGFRDSARKPLIRPQELVDMLHAYGTVSNSRICDDDTLQYADYLTMGDNMVPAGNIGVDFEAAGTMNESWHFKARDEEWKPAGELLTRLVDIAGKGGNYLLNVGPTGKGVIPDASASRIKTMGDWLEKNGAAIYGAKAGPHPHTLGWGSITQRKVGENTTLYLNVVDWPKNGTFHLYGLNNKILNASLLVSGNPLAFESKFNAAAGLNVLTITVPKTAPDPYVSVIALTLEGAASMDQALLQQRDGVVVLDGYQATIHDKEFVPNKPRRPVDFRMFTVPLKGDGIMPDRAMTVGGFNKVGQALSWDFKLIEPGTYEVAVVSLVAKGRAWKADGRMRATVAGQSVENELHERQRLENLGMPSKLKDSLSVLGTVTIGAPGMHTLTLEVSSEFAHSNPSIRSVMLLPVSREK